MPRSRRWRAHLYVAEERGRLRSRVVRLGLARLDANGELSERADSASSPRCMARRSRAASTNARGEGGEGVFGGRVARVHTEEQVGEQVEECDGAGLAAVESVAVRRGKGVLGGRFYVGVRARYEQGVAGVRKVVDGQRRSGGGGAAEQRQRARGAGDDAREFRRRGVGQTA